ncbi:MAG: NAD-dependent deacylase [Rhodospirillaceae bacterium]
MGKIVILTGAGISKESGLDTFRDKDGIWSKVRLEDVATPEAYARDPDNVHAFYNARRQGLLDADVQPNAAHEALVRLEQEWSDEVLLVTQNIDDLHERAGSKNLIHMHGELLKARCGYCDGGSGGERTDALFDWRQDMGLSDACPSCGGIGRMRPHVVWFGEVPLQMERIFGALSDCDLFLSIGTSGQVYPAAGFVQQVGQHGHGYTVEINLEPSHGASLFDDRIYGTATEKVPAFVDQLLKDGIPA